MSVYAFKIEDDQPVHEQVAERAREVAMQRGQLDIDCYVHPVPFFAMAVRLGIKLTTAEVPRVNGATSGMTFYMDPDRATSLLIVSDPDAPEDTMHFVAKESE